MKLIKNVTVRLSERTAKIAAEAGIAVVDTVGVYTTTAHFLCGENPWGLHQDYTFSSTISAIRQGNRICLSAEKAISEDLQDIRVTEEEHAILLKVLASPDPSNPTPIHPSLAREVLEIFDAIEFARSME